MPFRVNESNRHLSVLARIAMLRRLGRLADEGGGGPVGRK